MHGCRDFLLALTRPGCYLSGPGWVGSRFRAARRVGETGAVYAADFNPEAIRYIDERTEKEKLRNVKTILGKADDPLLPKDAVDAVLLLKTYHEVADPVALLRTCMRRFVAERKLESPIATETARITA